jgi:hypothetical protein
LKNNYLLTPNMALLNSAEGRLVLDISIREMSKTKKLS